MKRLRILNDFAFQKALGEKGDEPQLLAFLNAVLALTGKGNLQSVEILEAKDLPAEAVGGKSGKLDVLAKLPSGSMVNIEVQLKDERNIEKRSFFYLCRKYIEGLRAGVDYKDLLPVIGINILNFEFGLGEDPHTCYRLREERTGELMAADLCEIHFLDMVKFRRTKERSLEDPLTRWLVYFDETSPETLIKEVITMDDAIKMVQEKMDLIYRDPELFRAYESLEKAERDYISGMNTAEARGKAEEKREIARKALAEGLSIGLISQITGLTEEQIQAL